MRTYKPITRGPSKGWEFSCPSNSIGSLSESLTRGLLVGKLFVGGLGVTRGPSKQGAPKKSLYIYTHTHTHTHTHTLRIYIYVYIYIYIYIHLSLYIYIYIYVLQPLKRVPLKSPCESWQMCLILLTVILC